MTGDIVTKAAVSVTEMAKMVGLSRARFYQLVRKGTFPAADQDTATNRPCYLEEKQRQILEARRRNCGVDGKPILFYCRRNDAGQKRSSSRPTIAKVKEVVKRYADLIDGLAALNVTASVAQVEPLMKELFPNGTEGIDPGEVIRAVFLRIQRQNSAGNA
jgi:hypothetical protein